MLNEQTKQTENKTEDIMETEDKYFPELIGLESTKRKLGFYLDGYKKNNFFPPSIFCGQKGVGKSMIASCLGEELNKPFLEVNCSSIKGMDAFWDQIAVPHLSNGKITLFMDECSDLPAKLTLALLTILNPNSSNINTYGHRGQSITFDLRNITWVFATTDPQSVNTALMDRLERIEISNYNNAELGKILIKNLKLLSQDQFNIDPSIVEYVSSTVRGNARSAVKLAKDITQYLTNTDGSWLTLKDWEKLMHYLNIRELGISNIELSLMKTLESSGACTLNHLAACLGSPKSAIQNVYEQYLLKLEFIKIGNEGRQLTPKGVEYLKRARAIDRGEIVAGFTVSD